MGFDVDVNSISFARKNLANAHEAGIKAEVGFEVRSLYELDKAEGGGFDMVFAFDM